MIPVEPIIRDTVRVFLKTLDEPNILMPNKHVHIVYDITTVTV